MLRDLFVREGYEFDFNYDWIIRKQQVKSRMSLGSRNTLIEEEKRAQNNGGDTTNRGTQLNNNAGVPSTSQNFYHQTPQPYYNDQP